MGREAKRKSLNGMYSFSLPDFELSDEQVKNLEMSGRLKFTPALVRTLNEVINFYIRQRERYSQSPSRGEEERYLKDIEAAVSKILQPLNSLRCEQNIDLALDRALQRIQSHAPRHFEIESASEQLYCLQGAVKKAREEFKAEYREDTGADDAKNYLLFSLDEIYEKAKGKKGRRSRFIEIVYQSLPEAYKPQKLNAPDSEAKQIKRAKNKNQ